MIPSPNEDRIIELLIKLRNTMQEMTLTMLDYQAALDMETSGPATAAAKECTESLIKKSRTSGGDQVNQKADSREGPFSPLR